VQEIEELKRQGLSIQAISRLLGFDRKTIRKYLLKPEGTPAYGPRPARPSKLDAFKQYVDERLGCMFEVALTQTASALPTLGPRTNSDKAPICEVRGRD